VGEAEALVAPVLEPGEVVEVAAVRDRDDAPARLEGPGLRGNRLGGGDDRVGLPGDEPRDTGSRLLLDERGSALVGPMGIESRRSATHATPVAFFTAAPIRWIEPGGDVVSTTSIPSLRTIEIALGIAVAFQVTFSSGTSARRPIVDARRSARSSPLRPCSSSAMRRPRGPT
jgi:hypothetical protein